MTSQANVYTSVANVVWQTDKVQISTGNTAVTYQVWLAPDFANSIYSNAVAVPAILSDVATIAFVSKELNTSSWLANVV